MTALLSHDAGALGGAQRDRWGETSLTYENDDVSGRYFGETERDLASLFSNTVK